MSIKITHYGSLSEEGLNQVMMETFNSMPYPRVVVLPPLHYDYVTACKNGDKEGMRRAENLIYIRNCRNLTQNYLEAKKRLDKDTYRAFCLLKAMWGMTKNWYSSAFRYEWHVFSHWDSESDLNTGTNLVLTDEGFELVTYESWGMSYYAELEKQKLTFKQALEL